MKTLPLIFVCACFYYGMSQSMGEIITYSNLSFKKYTIAVDNNEKESFSDSSDYFQMCFFDYTDYKKEDSLHHLITQQKDTLKWYSIHFQNTIVNQYKMPFVVKYNGENSLSDKEENRVSVTSTFYLGSKLWRNSSVFINPEMAAGEGLSQTLGLAGASNGETFRIGNPKPAIYIARLFYQQIIPLLSNGKRGINKDIDHFKNDDFNQLENYLPDKYFNIVLGKISIADYFDDNSFSHDPRAEFMNWALMSSAAWDYPANTRGYTPSLVVEYFAPKYECRWSISMVPTTANGNRMNTQIDKAHSITFENVFHYHLFGKKGSVRIIGFYTTANMGNYKDALRLDSLAPDIIQTRQYGRSKYGGVINIEQFIRKESGWFLKLSWNDGKNETWAFTEIDHALSMGISIHSFFPNLNDNFAIAYALNGISEDHRKYLKHGGKGFMLGDGNLNYGMENIIEAYYKVALKRELLFLTLDYQCIFNPGYNKDRKGPVHIFSVRTHIRI